MTRPPIVIAAIVTALALAAARPLRAEPADDLPGAGVASQQPPATATLPAAVPDATKREFHGAITAGVEIQSGVTSAWGGMFDGTATRPYSNDGTLVLRGNYNYAKVVVYQSQEVDEVQTDRTLVSLGVEHNYGAHGVFMAQTGYVRDPLHQIFYRFEQLAGYGVRLSDKSKRVEFRFVPGLAVLSEDSYLEGPEGWLLGAGFYQRLTVKVDKTWSFNDSITYRRDFRVNDVSIEADASFTGMLTKVVGLQTQYQYILETFVPAGIKPYQQTLQVGLQLKF